MTECLCFQWWYKFYLPQNLYSHSYDHPHIMAGQGTMGLEILEQVPDVDAILVPVGGGGLLAGVATAVKHLKPHVLIYVSLQIIMTSLN